MRFKKPIIALSVTVTVLGILAGTTIVIDKLVDSVDINKSVKTLFNKVSMQDYVINNLGYFTPSEIKSNLKVIEKDIPTVTTSKVLSSNILITVPLYTKEIRDTFNETLFAMDGSFYIAASKEDNSFNENKTIEFSTQDLGIRSPKIIVARIPNSNVNLYIQCYTEEAFTFFTSKEMKNLNFQTTSLDFSNTADSISSNISIKESLYPKKKEMYLDPVYLEAIKNNSKNIEGYSDFIIFKDKYLIYYKGIGFLDARMKIEYAKLTSMGYKPLEVGEYKNISYIKFDKLTVLGKSLTKNSSLIYHVSNLN